MPKSGVNLMNKQDLVRDMKSHIGGGGFITLNQLRKYRHARHENILALVDGLEYFEKGKSKEFFIPDVAARILEEKLPEFRSQPNK